MFRRQRNLVASYRPIILFYSVINLLLIIIIIIIIIIDTFIKRHKCLGYRGAETNSPAHFQVHMYKIAYTYVKYTVGVLFCPCLLMRKYLRFFSL